MIKEIKAQYVRESEGEYTLTSPESSLEFWKNVIQECSWFDSEKECVVVLCLDNKKKVKAYNIVSIGTHNESFAGPKEIFRPVILSGASSFILMHNHPSGDPSPSRADHEVTRRTKEGANIFSLEFTDHIVVGDSYFSFRESGLL